MGDTLAGYRPAPTDFHSRSHRKMKVLLVSCLALVGIQSALALPEVPGDIAFALPSYDLVVDPDSLNDEAGQERATCRKPEVCENLWSNCQQNADSGACNRAGSFRDRLAKNCKLACGWCDGVPDIKDVCADQWSNCQDHANRGYCTADWISNDFRAKLEKNCKKACNWCNGVPKVVKKCKDKDSRCAVFQGYGYCTHSWVSWMKDNCAQTCGAC